MRVVSPGLLAKLGAETQRLAGFLWLRRPDGFTVTLSSCDIDVSFEPGVISGGQDVSGLYLCNPGIGLTNIVWTSGLNVDNLEIQFLEDDTYINKTDVLSKKWSKTEFRLFRADPLDPGAGIDTLMVGHMGDVQVYENRMQAELRSVVQLLQQTVGEVTTKTCKTFLFSPKCTVDQAANTFIGTMTSGGRQVFTDSSRSEPDDWFGDGEVVFNDGPAQGMRAKVRSYLGASGQFTLVMPLLAAPQIGDSYTAYTGCRKRCYEDCRDKFSNILNFQGEPHVPGNDYITNPGDVQTS